MTKIKTEQDNIIDKGALKIVKVTEDTVCHSFDIVGLPLFGCDED